eukprot:978459_1
MLYFNQDRYHMTIPSQYLRCFYLNGSMAISVKLYVENILKRQLLPSFYMYIPSSNLSIAIIMINFCINEIVTWYPRDGIRMHMLSLKQIAVRVHSIERHSSQWTHHIIK